MRRCIRVRRLVLLAVLGGTAHADQPVHGHAGLDMSAGFGPVGELGRTSGWGIRIAAAAYPALAPRGELGGLVGFEPAMEYWRAGTDSGFGLAMMHRFGVRGFGLRATLGFGFDAVLVDDVANATGVGCFAPIAAASFGIDVFGVRVGADAQIERRWLFGADDHTQWKLAFVAGYTWESELEAPYR